MRRLRFTIPQESWGTTATKYPANAPAVGADDFTGATKNVDTDSLGIIQKRPGDVNYEATSTTGTIKDLYEAVFSDGARHLLRLRSGTLEFSTGSGSFTAVTGAPSYSSLGNFEFASYADRTYFGNGIDNPQVYDKTASYGGVAYTAPKTKEMGAQAPSSAPTAAVGGAGNVPIGSYTYKVTYLYYDFQESNGSAASNLVSPGVASQINLTAIPVGGYGVTARKIYRSNDSGLTYRLVGTISNNTATVFTDDAATATAFIPLDNGGPRNFTLIVQHKDRMWVAGIPGDPTELDYSAAGLPDIWPSTNTVACNSKDPITGLVVYNDRVIVFNRSSFGQILGNDPTTFRYAEVPGSVGCVDHRTIQIRVVGGVPVLLWLSEKNIYAFNGSTVVPISETISDLLQFNIQQASQVRGANSQSSQADFNSGFKITGGAIDLTTNPGTISTANPKYLIDEQAEWEGGSSVSAIATRRVAAPNRLTMAEKTTFTRASGTLSGTVLTGGNIEIPLASNHTGESKPTSLFATHPAGNVTSLAFPVTLSRAGTIGNVTFTLSMGAASAFGYKIKVWSDTAGAPGTEVFATSTITSPAPLFGFSLITVNQTISASVGSGTYWFGVERDSTSGAIALSYPSPAFSGGNAKVKSSGTWVAPGSISGSAANASSYTFTQTAVPASGSWTSTSYDSALLPQAASIVSTVNHTATYPSGTSANTFIDQADDTGFTIGVVSSSAIANLNGSSGPTFAATKRYWRVRVNLATTDDRVTPSVTSDPTLQFPTSVTWISQSIDNTLSITALNQLIVEVNALESGTTATAVVQKSTAVGGPFTDEGSFPLVAGTNTLALGTVTNPLQRYTRIKLILDNSTTPTNSPEITSFLLKWTTVSSLYSSVIDTGATPAGWDIFQASVTSAGAGVTFGFRADAVSGNLTDDVPSGPFSPSFVSVTNGSAITGATVARFAQWCVTLTATADNVPLIDSITINWLISSVASIRAASIFYDQSYYLSLAEYNNLTNNVLLVFDQEGKWRVWRGQSIGTFSFFFNEPYFGDGAVAQVRKFVEGTTDHGNAIELDFYTKAFDLEAPEKRKAIRAAHIMVENTGATYTVRYSTDRGMIWRNMVDSTGATTFTVPTNNDFTTLRLVPPGGQELQGKTLQLRVTESTTAQAKVHSLTLDAYVREGDVING